MAVTTGVMTAVRASRSRLDSHCTAVWATTAVPELIIFIPRSIPFRVPGTIFRTALGRTALRRVVVMVMAMMMMMVTHGIAKILTFIELIEEQANLLNEAARDYR
jgi:hypothetical protein